VVVVVLLGLRCMGMRVSVVAMVALIRMGLVLRVVRVLVRGLRGRIRVRVARRLRVVLVVLRRVRMVAMRVLPVRWVLVVVVRSRITRPVVVVAMVSMVVVVVPMVLVTTSTRPVVVVGRRGRLPVLSRPASWVRATTATAPSRSPRSLRQRHPQRRLR
jgi:hypothetical protein